MHSPFCPICRETEEYYSSLSSKKNNSKHHNKLYYFKFGHNGARFNFSSKKSENSGKLFFQFFFLINNVSSEICFLLPSCRVKRPCGKPRCIEFDQTELLKDNLRKSSMQREQVMLYFPCSVFAELSLQLSVRSFNELSFFLCQTISLLLHTLFQAITSVSLQQSFNNRCVVFSQTCGRRIL